MSSVGIKGEERVGYLASRRSTEKGDPEVGCLLLGGGVPAVCYLFPHHFSLCHPLSHPRGVLPRTSRAPASVLCSGLVLGSGECPCCAGLVSWRGGAWPGGEVSSCRDKHWVPHTQEGLRGQLGVCGSVPSGPSATKGSMSPPNALAPDTAVTLISQVPPHRVTVPSDIPLCLHPLCSLTVSVLLLCPLRLSSPSHILLIL